MGIRNTITEFFAPKKAQISELIGNWASQFSQLRQTLRMGRPTVDTTETDYEWYDKFRRGKQKGFEIGGLFADPMAEIIASWALGDGFSLDIESEATQEAVEKFLQTNLQSLVESAQDSLSLGDAYILVNPDGLLQKISPDQVKLERDALDFNTIVSATIYTQNEKVEIEDIYTVTNRLVRIRYAGKEWTEQSFPNLIGLIPLIPFFNDRSANETNGHPYFESLLTLFAEYDDVMRKGLDGAKLMANPIPVAEGLKDPEGAKRLNATYIEPYVDGAGVSQNNYVTELDKVSVFWLGEGAKFHLAAPGNFSTNTTDMLKKLFYVMLQHAKIPEWVWGGAISSSMASVQAQAPAFIKFIQGRQRKLEQPIRLLLNVYLKTIALFTPSIVTDGDFVIEWPELMPVDKEIMLKWVMWLQENGMVTKETALRLADVVKDVADEVKDASAEQKTRENEAISRQAKMDMQSQAMAARFNAKPATGNNPAFVPKQNVS